MRFADLYVAILSILLELTVCCVISTQILVRKEHIAKGSDEVWTWHFVLRDFANLHPGKCLLHSRNRKL